MMMFWQHRQWLKRTKISLDCNPLSYNSGSSDGKHNFVLCKSNPTYGQNIGFKSFVAFWLHNPLGPCNWSKWSTNEMRYGYQVLQTLEIQFLYQLRICINTALCNLSAWRKNCYVIERIENCDSSHVSIRNEKSARACFF